MKKIKDIKNSREEKYNYYRVLINEVREHMNKINEILPALIEAQNEMLTFMEKAVEISSEMKGEEEDEN